jgi:CTP:molybdopterin cytidylyltransferase MocA
VTVAVVLAAGSGMRLGGVAKALLRDGHLTFLERIAATLEEVDCQELIVVVGPPFADAVAAAARALDAQVIVNPQPERGMASSDRGRVSLARRVSPVVDGRRGVVVAGGSSVRRTG